MNETDKAYIAGLLDGDGSVGWQTQPTDSGPKKYLRVRIFNTHIGVLQWCQSTSGLGKISIKKIRSGPYGAWLTCSDEARSLLRDIVPYLKIKVSEARDAL